MSLSASRYTNSAMSRSDEIGSDLEIQDYLTGRKSWRAALRAAPHTHDRPSFTRKGLEDLVRGGVKGFEDVTGVQLPHNLEYSGSPWEGFPNNGTIREWPELDWNNWHCAVGVVDRFVGTAARFAGWIDGAVDFPALVQLLSRETSQAGQKSPHTTVYVWRLVERWPSPGAANAAILRIRHRAAEILRPYGLSPSWHSLGQALQFGPKGTGKAAIYAAAWTVVGRDHYGDIRGYKEARSLLASLSKTVDAETHHDDGVEFISTEEPILSRGIMIYRGLVREFPETCQGLLLVSPRGETYHIDQCTNLRWAVLTAVRAWKARRALLLEEGILSSDKVCVLVTRQDSYAAGNCEPGTDRFAKENGWGRRWYVPANWLADKDDPRAKNAAKAAIRRVAREMAA